MRIAHTLSRVPPLLYFCHHSPATNVSCVSTSCTPHPVAYYTSSRATFVPAPRSSSPFPNRVTAKSWDNGKIPTTFWVSREGWSWPRRLSHRYTSRISANRQLTSATCGRQVEEGSLCTTIIERYSVPAPVYMVQLFLHLCMVQQGLFFGPTLDERR